MSTDLINQAGFPEVLDSKICAFAERDFALDISQEHLYRCSQSRQLIEGQAFDFYCALAILFARRKDSVTALMYLNTARKFSAALDEGRVSLLVSLLLALKQTFDALDVYLEAHFRDARGVYADSDGLKRLAVAHRALVRQSDDLRAHGHLLLMDGVKTWLAKHPQASAQGPLRLLEVGSTREEVAGQGSTRKLSEFCLSNGLLFTTVDMDPFNTEQAARVFKEQSSEAFEAVNAKGEDYLRQTDLVFHFVFLDAYDFDHGRHSEQRQSRYRKFLGGPIDEAQCHQMHLECAQQLLQRLHPEGLVCIDDTWLDDGRWTAKGTLAVPYLLQQGFEVVDIRNRAVLMRRTSLNADGHSHAKPV